MSDLTVAVTLKLPGGAPATGLTLADIDIWLTQQDRATGVDTVIWDGTENPTEEMDNTGSYIRIYAGADLDLYNYYAVAEYTGATGLERDWVQGAIGIENIPIGTSLIKPYIVYYDGTSDPIEGVKVEIHRNAAGTDVIWVGWTNVLGEARDAYGNYPRLDPAPAYYFWRYKAGLSFDNPDTESVP
jgi:hypothetical protein